MLKVPDGRVKEFSDAVMNHRVNVSAMNVYFQNVRMLNGKHKYIDRDTYSDIFKHALSDIELVSSPIDSFVPADDDVDDLFYVNRLMTEYVEISKRLTIDALKTELGTAHPAIIAVINNECTIDRLIDDIYIYYCLFKYIDMIDIIQIKSYSYLTPIIEWIVDNVTLKDIKSFIHTKKHNPEKYTKNFEDLIFNPEFAITRRFYTDNRDINETSLFCDPFDIMELMMELTSNIVIKSDVSWIIGIYMICSFAIFDKANADDSKITKYVRDVISKIL